MRSSRFSDEQIIAILREHEAGRATTEVCRKHRISGTTFYKWKAKYGGMQVESRLKAGNAKLRPQDWRSGDRLWVIDVLAPFGAGDEMVKDLKLKLFPDRPLNLLTVDGGRLTAKVV